MKKLSLGLLIIPRLLFASDSTIYTYFHAGQEDAVIAAYENLTSEQQHTLSPMIQCMVAESKLKIGDYQDGFKLFDQRLIVDNGRDGNTRAQRLTNPWDGSNPKGKTITVISEGGDGDTMSFFLPYCILLQQQGAQVTLALSGNHKKLSPLLKEHATLKEHGISFMEVGDKERLSAGDYQVYLMSLPRYLSVDPETGKSRLHVTTTVNEIPRTPLIKIKASTIDFWVNALPKNKFVIALCHRASTLPPGQHDRYLDRSIPLNIIVPTICHKLGKENVVIINLLQKFHPAVAASKVSEEQYKRAEAKNKKLKEAADRIGKTFIPVDPSTTADKEDILDDDYMSVMLDPFMLKNDFDQDAYVDTGALITILGTMNSPCTGAVATVETSVLSEAGLIVAGQNKEAVRVVGLLSNLRDWREGMDTHKSPWYPELIMLTQEHQGDWQPVANKCAQQCAEWKEHSTKNNHILE